MAATPSATDTRSTATPATTAAKSPRNRSTKSKSDDPQIVVRGAREHNLKNVNVELPRDKLIVFTGLSGSGKSSLAFDTIYAEGQRRYVESLSSYARQFLGQMDKPDVDAIEGLSPAVAIEQRQAGANPRSPKPATFMVSIPSASSILIARNSLPALSTGNRRLKRFFMISHHPI